MEETAKYGNSTIKIIYGDWTKPHLSKWKTYCCKMQSRPFCNTHTQLGEMPLIQQWLLMRWKCIRIIKGVLGR